MTVFRAWLITVFVAISAYTVPVLLNDGIMALLPTFFGDMMKLGWPGQFNLDFMMMLSLSAIWVSWRHQFSVSGLLLGLLAFFGGALFLSIYLFIASLAANGDAKVLLLGNERSTTG